MLEPAAAMAPERIHMGRTAQWGSSLTQVPCLHPQSHALPVAPSCPWGRAACPDLVEAGLGGAIRPSLDPGVWKEERQEEEREAEEEDKEEARDDLPPLH